MRPEASRRSRLPSAPAPSVSWKNPTERWTQKQPPQRTEESVFLGGPIPIGKVGKIEKKVKEFEITFTQKKGEMIHFGGMGSGNLWWTIYPTSKWIMKKWNYHDHSWSNYQPSTRRKTETHHAYFFQFGDRIWRSSLETPWAWSLPKFPKQPTTIQPQPLKPQAITKATQKAGQGAPSWMLQ